MEMIFSSTPKKNDQSTDKKGAQGESVVDENLKNKDLREQIKYIINLPDEEYNEKMLTSELR
jgi:hypothetical protein